MKYTEIEFNKQDATYTRQIDTLKKLVEMRQHKISKPQYHIMSEFHYKPTF